MAGSGPGLLLIVLLALAAADRLGTRVSHELQSGSTRAGWYLSSGQWLADVRTFTAACQFIMEDDTDATGRDRVPGIQLATPESDTTPDLSGLIEVAPQPLKDS